VILTRQVQPQSNCTVNHNKKPRCVAAARFLLF
jgi:hypothetical protein